MATMTDAERLDLIREVFEKCFVATNSFDGEDLGCELGYLFAEIANRMPPEPENDWGVEWCEETHEYHLKLFMSLFPADHKVWPFIDIVTDDNDEEPTLDAIRKFKQGLAPQEQP
jgi:hypothetical protein